MKKICVVLALVGVVWGVKVVVDGMSRQMSREDAQNRVRMVLLGLKQGASDTQYQTAVCMWKAGALTVAQEDFRNAADEFDAWARERGLSNLDRFEIGGAVVEKVAYALDPAVVVVKGSVNGRPFVARSARRKTLAWQQ